MNGSGQTARNEAEALRRVVGKSAPALARGPNLLESFQESFHPRGRIDQPPCRRTLFSHQESFLMPVSADLLHQLRTWGRLPAGELVNRLGISRATLMRAVRTSGDVVGRGSARRRAYAAKRAVRGAISPIAWYSVDPAGRVDEVALLSPTHGGGCAVEFLRPLEWPLDQDMQDGWFDGLPYPLEDLRPQGFMGRNFAREHAALLQVPEDPRLWSEDDVLHALSILGSDQPGSYIVGEPALRRWLDQSRAPTAAIADDERARAYPALAAAAMLQGVPGSSAGGEFPKFTATREIAGQIQHVLVKFSGSDEAPGTQRWADLLVCEALASSVVREDLGIAAVQSEISRFGGRTFLEVQRFDRHGTIGRSPVCSWYALNGGLFGMAGKPWTAAADALHGRGFISDDVREQIKTLWHFGQLIANSDMHDGNLSFTPGLSLAPCYDMLPMTYAPDRGVELSPRSFAPTLPLPSERKDWEAARIAATIFWETAAADARITIGFRDICARNAESLTKL